MTMNSPDGSLYNNMHQIHTSFHGQASKDAVTQRSLGMPDLDVKFESDVYYCRDTHLGTSYSSPTSTRSSTLRMCTQQLPIQPDLSSPTPTDSTFLPHSFLSPTPTNEPLPSVNLHQHPELNHPAIYTGRIAPSDLPPYSDVRSPPYDDGSPTTQHNNQMYRDGIPIADEDNLPWGLSYLTPTPPGTINIFYQNMYRYPDDPYVSMAIVKRDFLPDILCLSELSINLNKQSHAKIHKDLNACWDHSTMSLAHTGDNFLMQKYKPGGVGIMALGPTTRRVIQKGRDDLGRRARLSLALRRSTTLTIITLYRPCHTTIQAAKPKTYLMQLYR